MTFPSHPEDFTITNEHDLFNAAVHDLSQWAAALPYLSGADLTTLWPHLRAKIKGLELYSPSGTRN